MSLEDPGVSPKARSCYSICPRAQDGTRTTCDTVRAGALESAHGRGAGASVAGIGAVPVDPGRLEQAEPQREPDGQADHEREDPEAGEQPG
jgi:hypothetical protein